MKKQVRLEIGDYSFDASERKVTLIGCGDLTLENMLIITNVTDGIQIYNFAKTTGTITDNVLTLSYDTTLMSDTDELQIFINVDDISLADINTTLQFLQNQLEVLAQVEGKLLKIHIQAGNIAISNAPNVSAVLNQTRIGDIQANRQIEFLMEQAFYAGYGNNIIGE